ncbi:dihydrofolate reductase [Lentiprolixibacter aurantiacus]|uniref:Dihydrofolate reductase n=1 Tax=Lentiprolixibacter aurantiacus TaxID=2993939 RepID=A0AAE3MJZ6_9FLAO|nr:dihydrofolate reductase [Lentiprolixibacter aurantiacus]MCX2719105.1 dihydrofolate reductase [Lentiprolixibacter aurantiacus]
MGAIITIAAVGENGSLGKDNKLLWHLPDDFKRFKQITTGHKIIMGRKTFESFPKPLPNRFHIIITRNLEYSTDHPQCKVVHSLQEALQLVEENEKAFIIGGGEIYTQALPYSDLIELTRVHANFEADAFFPEIKAEEWEIVGETHHEKDERHAYAFTYITYKRK